MKPRTNVVMQNIIHQIRDTFPFTISAEELCAETCSHGCPKKLLEYIDMEIIDWEQQLENGVMPNFRDIQKLTKTSENIYRVLVQNELIPNETAH